MNYNNYRDKVSKMDDETKQVLIIAIALVMSVLIIFGTVGGLNTYGNYVDQQASIERMKICTDHGGNMVYDRDKQVWQCQ